MRNINFIVILGMVSCTDAGLPRRPQVSKLEAVSSGDSLKVYWNSIEGVDYYRVYSDKNLVYEGKDTSIILGYSKSFRIEAIGLNDKLSSDYDLNDKFYEDSIFIIPQMEVLAFSFPKFTIYSINDTTKIQQFVIFFAQDSSRIGNSQFNKDSLKVFSASLYYNKFTDHKINFYNDEKILPFPDKDSLNLIFKKNYVLWFNPDTIGWDNTRDYFINFRVDSLTFSVDSLNDTTYYLKVYYKVRTISGLRWF